MAKKNSNNDQFVLSLEMLHLLLWLVEHEAESLKKIIHKALNNGLSDQIKKSLHANEPLVLEQAQYSVIDFLELTEILLAEATMEHTANAVIQRNKIPALDHIDSTQCDTATIKSSVTSATSKMHKDADMQETMLRELLKRWKPNKKVLPH